MREWTISVLGEETHEGSGMDWEGWARRLERSTGVEDFAALFADAGEFCDPVTPWTTDVRRVAQHTAEIFPDWAMRVDRIRGGEDWAVMEWTGTGTFLGNGRSGVTVVVHGASVIDTDADGKVTRWRDYLDTNEPIQQIQATPPPT